MGLALDRGQFFIDLDIEVVLLILISKVDAPLLADLVVDVEDDPHLVEGFIEVRPFEGDLDVWLSDEH